MQVRVDGRQHGIFRIGGPDVIGVVNAAIGWIEMAGKSLQRVDRLRVASWAKLSRVLKMPSAAGIGRPSDLSFTATSAVRTAPAEVP